MEAAVLLSLLVFAAVAQAIYLATPSAPRERDVIAQRLAAYSFPLWQGGLLAEVSVLRRKQYSGIPWLDRWLRRVDFGEKLATSLRRAGVPMRAGEFLFAQLLVALAAGFLGLIFLGSMVGGIVAVGAPSIVGFLAPLLWLRFKRASRISTFTKTLPDALDLITGSLKAGYGISHGLELVAKEFPGPCGEEFGQVHEELNLGSDFDVALARLVERMDSEDVRLLATAVAVQRRTGGNLVEVLNQLTHTIRERIRLRGEVHVITTAPRVSGYVVGLLPVATVGFMYATSRYYVDVLFSDPLGHVAMAVGGVMVLIGMYCNHKIADIDF